MKTMETKLVRIKPAANILGISEKLLRRWVTEGKFSSVRPSGFGTGRMILLHVDELHLYAETGDWAAVENFRKKKKRI